MTREYVVEGVGLSQTTAGRAIEGDIARAREEHERCLQALRGEYRQAMEAADERAAAELEAILLATEVRLRRIAEETEVLRESRNKAQKRLDVLEASSSRSSFDQRSLSTQDNYDRHHAREKRAVRWFGRFLAKGSTVVMSALTGGATLPVGLTLVGIIESVCQADRAHEAALDLARNFRENDGSSIGRIYICHRSI